MKIRKRIAQRSTSFEPHAQLIDVCNEARPNGERSRLSASHVTAYVGYHHVTVQFEAPPPHGEAEQRDAAVL